MSSSSEMTLTAGAMAHKAMNRNMRRRDTAGGCEIATFKNANRAEFAAPPARPNTTASIRVRRERATRKRISSMGEPVKELEQSTTGMATLPQDEHYEFAA